MMKFIPVPGYGAGDLSPAHTLNDYLDRLLMPGQLKFGDRDPLGILATIPAIGTALAGAITGHLLKIGSLWRLFQNDGDGDCGSDLFRAGIFVELRLSNQQKLYGRVLSCFTVRVTACCF